MSSVLEREVRALLRDYPHDRQPGVIAVPIKRLMALEVALAAVAYEEGR